MLGIYLLLPSLLLLQEWIFQLFIPTSRSVIYAGDFSANFLWQLRLVSNADPSFAVSKSTTAEHFQLPWFSKSGKTQRGEEGNITNLSKSAFSIYRSSSSALSNAS